MVTLRPFCREKTRSIYQESRQPSNNFNSIKIRIITKINLTAEFKYYYRNFGFVFGTAGGGELGNEVFWAGLCPAYGLLTVDGSPRGGNAGGGRQGRGGAAFCRVSVVGASG